jgi:hypothetical protein
VFYGTGGTGGTERVLQSAREAKSKPATSTGQ